MGQLTINLTVEDIERLVGNDPVAFLKLNETIIVKFSERHLKAIANSQTIKRATSVITDAIELSLKEEIGVIENQSWNKSKVKLSEKFEERIKNFIQDFIIEQLLSVTKDDVKQRIQLFEDRIVKEGNDNIKRIFDEINKQIESKVDARINLEVERRFNDLINSVKDKL